ncbi:MAG: hypothetical protein WBN55_14505 [Eudoraea sp.]|uniref:hypothetical protein n=1 Tax=Eudoraea sp. TaxID=1979955 RepID=UPI002626D65E|nr:hypothetical protein [uncultured Eudoraea sp.]
MKIIRKNAPFTLFLSFTALLTLVSCGEQKAKDEVPEVKQEEIKAPEQIVSVDQARSMYKSYSERRAPLIQNYEDAYDKRDSKMKDSFDVARYVYYDYKTIKDYLTYIEKVAAKANVEISTLRFYFSNYPNQAKFEDGSPVIHPRQNSVFILPASIVDNAQYGFYLEEQEDGTLVPAYLSWDLAPYIPEGMGMIQEDGNSYAGMGPNLDNSNSSSLSPMPFIANVSTILNEGGSAPPPKK